MNPLSINEQRLVLEIKIAERALIIYVNESAIADNEGDEHEWPESYKAALRDEIENHKTIMEEYQEELKKLNNA
jgi:hypothetical protein